MYKGHIYYTVYPGNLFATQQRFIRYIPSSKSNTYSIYPYQCIKIVYNDCLTY